MQKPYLEDDLASMNHSLFCPGVGFSIFVIKKFQIGDMNRPQDGVIFCLRSRSSPQFFPLCTDRQYELFYFLSLILGKF